VSGANIQIQHLNKTFGTGADQVQALGDINLDIRPGEIFGIIGLSGAGKSTLARALGERYGLPVLHFDTTQFTPNWQERDRDEAHRMVHAFMENPEWVIDGNYTKFEFERRLEEADKIVKAQRSRGGDFRSGSLRRRLNSIIAVVVPLLYNALKRADDLAIAMEARAYVGGEGRVSLRELRWRAMDTLALVDMLIFAVCLCVSHF